MTHEATTTKIDMAREATLWESMAEELVLIVKEYLEPYTSHPVLSSEAGSHYIRLSTAAAHWVQLCKKFLQQAHPWRQRLSHHRRCHQEAAACCRVLEAARDRRDWALEVLKLRGLPSPSCERGVLSPATPLSRSALRSAYMQVAKEVHPDRTCVPLATQAMSVVNEAYRQAFLLYGERGDVGQQVMILDVEGLEHLQP